MSQSPVFPWTIADYRSQELDLANEAVFRDLSKPVDALDQNRLREILETQRQLVEAGVEPHMFSSEYSFPLHIGLWMITLEPSTSVHIEIFMFMDIVTRLI
jgi:factor associated with neutral sphingomyelinase activation